MRCALRDVSDRQGLIEAAKQSYVEFGDSLFKEGLAECFDTCAMAYFHDVLYGDGDITTTEEGGGPAGYIGGLIPLHEAIRIEERGSGAVHNDAFAPANSKQLAEVASWLAIRIVHDACRIHPGAKELESLEPLSSDEVSLLSLDCMDWMRFFLFCVVGCGITDC